ncbi:MAG: hypothetical protein GQ470_03060, partial [Gammaproteobacteria bacterium]|nr:hypothetical protein [Gammaproteobacteria bacterium]
MVNRTKSFLYLGLIFCTIILLYLPGLYGPFLFDDFHNIVLNKALHPSSWNELWGVIDSRESSNRIVSLFTFGLNYLFGGMNASEYRIVNISIHITNALLLFAIAKLLLARVNNNSEGYAFRIALWAALLWAINPVQIQAVTYIVQRMTSLATLFYLLAIYSYILLRLNKIGLYRGAVLVLLFFLLGLGSKLIVATLPITLLAMDILLFRKECRVRKRDIAIFALCAVLGFLYLYLKDYPLFHSWADPLPGREFSIIERLLTEARVIFHYISLIFYPHIDSLQLDYDIGLSTGLFTPITTVISIVGIIGLLWIAFYMRVRAKLAAFAIIFFFIANVIESTFFNLELAFVHRVYLPSTFIYLGMLSLVPRECYNTISPILILAFAFFAFTTYERNSEWGRGDILWQKDIQRGASVERSLINRSANLMDQGQYREVVLSLAPLISESGERTNEYPITNDTYYKALLILGQTYFLFERYQNAIGVL